MVNTRVVRRGRRDVFELRIGVRHGFSCLQHIVGSTTFHVKRRARGDQAKILFLGSYHQMPWTLIPTRSPLSLDRIPASDVVTSANSPRIQAKRVTVLTANKN